MDERNKFTSPTVIENVGDTIPISRVYATIQTLFGKDPPPIKIDDDLDSYLQKCLEEKVLSKDEVSYLYFYLITSQYGQSYPPIPASLLEAAKKFKGRVIYDKLLSKENAIAGIFNFNSKEVAYISSFNPFIIQSNISQLQVLEHREIKGFIAPAIFVEEVHSSETYRPIKKSTKIKTGGLFTPRHKIQKDKGLELKGEKVFRRIMEEAVRQGATDVHILPLGEEEGSPGEVAVVDFRIRMALKPQFSLTEEEYRQLRAYFMSTMRIDDRPYSAVSSASAVVLRSGAKVRYRFSQMPSALPSFLDGIPKMSYVLRIHKSKEGINIDSLGMPAEVKHALTDAVSKRAGIIIISGATGSGKSTTVLSALKYLHETTNKTKKIITLEDPVEVRVSGILQTEVNEEAGYTFYAGLREALRHDPDVIFVGEVRDRQSAELLLQAAITGHLVLTTIHSFSLEEIPERLASLGIDFKLLINASLLYIEQIRLREFAPGTLKEKNLADGSVILEEPRDSEVFLHSAKDRVLFSALRFTEEAKKRVYKENSEAGVKLLLKELKTPKIKEQLIALYREKRISTQQLFEFLPKGEKIEL